MPFLRVSQDRRGYQHTFVLHNVHRRGRTQPSVLYWFRSPPGLRVGRGPLDEEAMRQLETAHPAVVFDWHRLQESLARGGAVEPAARSAKRFPAASPRRPRKA
jgi:hypothetical protein